MELEEYKRLSVPSILKLCLWAAGLLSACWFAAFLFVKFAWVISAFVIGCICGLGLSREGHCRSCSYFRFR